MNDPKESVTRASISAGQILVVVGLLLVYGVGGYWLVVEVFQDPDAPWFMKFGLPAIVIGLTILLGTVLFQRWQALKTDKYTDVED